MTPFDFIKLPERMSKPRQMGITSVIDKGLSFSATEQLLELSGNYIDIFKLGFGTACLYSEKILKNKIILLKSAELFVCPGGTLFEIAYSQNAVPEYFKECQRLGFNSIEISDGVFPISAADKISFIKSARQMGFTVFSEVGRKDAEKDQAFSIEQRIVEIHQQLDAGVSKVILESRESGSLGIYLKDTTVNEKDFLYLIESVNPCNLIFESPHKHQQIWLIKQLGSLANLANIALEDVISLECLRLALRADTISIDGAQ